MTLMYEKISDSCTIKTNIRIELIIPSFFFNFLMFLIFGYCGWKDSRELPEIHSVSEKMIEFQNTKEVGDQIRSSSNNNLISSL